MAQRAGILDLLQQEDAKALKRSRRAVIIQPGAIGDCILTLPLASFIKSRLKVGVVDMIGRADYIGYFPARTCVDTIRALDSVEVHRLFCTAGEFEIADRDPLAETFSGYSWIVSFLGSPESDFEQNLIFTANCSQSAQIIMLPLKSEQSAPEHISLHYIKQFCRNCDLPVPSAHDLRCGSLIQPERSDKRMGAEILCKADVNRDAPVVVLSPGSGSKAKCWHLSNFLYLAQKLQSAGIQPVFLLGPAEIERFSRGQITAIAEAAPCLTDLSLTEVLQVISCADAFVGNDSGITHLAAGMGVDTIAVFGPTDPKKYRPLGPSVRVLQDESPAFTSGPSQVLRQRAMQQLEKICA